MIVEEQVLSRVLLQALFSYKLYSTNKFAKDSFWEL